MNKALKRNDLDKLPQLRREQLMFKISSNQGLPSLGVAITEVIKITSTGAESVNKLAKFILSDVSLTRDILNLANSVTYRHSQAAHVTTISKAIFILGFDVVKSSALSMLLLDCFNDKDQGLYVELTRSLCASIIARKCFSRNAHLDAEEATISALFKNIGPLLVAALDQELYDAIMQPVRDGSISLHQSATNQIGCSLQHLGALILQQWTMPDSIIQATQALPTADIKKARHRSEWVKQVASFSADAAEVIMRNSYLIKDDGESSSLSMEIFALALMRKYGVALELDPHTLQVWLDRAMMETEALLKQLGLRMIMTPLPADLRLQESLLDTAQPPWALESIMMVEGSSPALTRQPCHPSGKPFQARELLLAGLMEMTQTIASGDVQLNNLVLQLLEILQASLGFQFVTACLKDVKSDQYVARISLGKNWQVKQKNFSFSAWEGPDLFHLALKNDADLMIGETASPRIQQLRPQWHLSYFTEVKSLMILPLIVNGKAIGLIYADRDCEAPEGVPPEETSLVKAMKNQLITVMGK